MRCTPISVLLGAVLFCISGALVAQTQGEFSGLATDSSGAVIADAKVTVTNTGTGIDRVTTTNGSGIYRMPMVQPGIYNIKVAASGFKTAVRTQITLQVQQSATVDFTLEVGEVTQSIEVSGAVAMLDTESATVGTVITNQGIVDLPLNGRDFLQLVALSPNVSYGFPAASQPTTRQGGDRILMDISIGGQRGTFNRYTLDGVEDTDVNFNTYMFLPSIDALDEFKVQSGIFPAEFGRATSQVNVSTKAGTNQFHGTVFEFLRNSALDATAYAFTANRPKKNQFKQNQYGFALAGPVWIPKIVNGKNRLFFMSNFEGFRSRKQLIGLNNVATVAQRSGNFSQTLPIFDPLTRAQVGNAVTATAFPGNQIPASRISPISTALLPYDPTPNSSVSGANFQTAYPQPIDKDQFTQRIDFQESDRSSWFGRFSWQDDASTTPGLFENGQVVTTNTRQAVIANTRTFSPSKVNEFRFGFSHFFNLSTGELAYKKNVTATLGLPFYPGDQFGPWAWGITHITPTGYAGFGNPDDSPWMNRNSTFQWVDNFSWVKGSHAIRFGGEIRRTRYNVQGNQYGNELFSFSGQVTNNPSAAAGTTGDAMADFLLGDCMRCELALALANGQMRSTSQNYYIDDVWKVRPHLTVSLGLRYEYTQPWVDRTGTMINVWYPGPIATTPVTALNMQPVLVRAGSGDFYQGTNMRFGAGIQVARDGRLGPALIASDYRNIAPRVGIAWSVSPKWTIRMGGGFFFAQDESNAVADLERNITGHIKGVGDPNFTNPASILSYTQPWPGASVASEFVTAPAVNAAIYGRTPYVIQDMFNIQRQLDSQTVFEAGYVGTLGHKLPQTVAVNVPLPSLTGTILSRTPYPEFGRIQETEDSNNSNYNALVLKLQRRLSRGLMFLVSHTYSRSIDLASELRQYANDVQYPQDSNNLQANRGPSAFNVTHRFTASLTYQLPLGKGHHFLSTNRAADFVLGGWQVGSIITSQTGFPFTISMQNTLDESNTGALMDHPNATGINPNYPRGQQDPQKFFNTAAFVIEPFGTYGNSGRDNVLGPGLMDLDFSAMKSFRVREGHRLEFRYEAFNITNHPDWGMPVATLPNANFGKVQSTAVDMRQMQFALKYVF